MKRQAVVLCAGNASGRALRLEAPISFWGGVDPVSSRIMATGHPQHGCEIAETILVVPYLIGSSSSSAVLAELLYRGRHPRALILGERDAILPIGALVAQEMGWSKMPVVLVEDPPFTTGQSLTLDASGLVTVG